MTRKEEKCRINAWDVLTKVNEYIEVLEAKKAARSRWERGPVTVKMNDVYRDLSIFDWWKDDLSLTNLKDMKAFLEEAVKLGFNGYVCFKVGVTGCSNGMWAHTDMSTDGFSPDTGRCIYKSFTPAYNYWSFTDEGGNWLPESGDGHEYDELTTVRKFESAYYNHFCK